MTQGSPLSSGDGRSSASGDGNKMSVISGSRMRETIHSGHFMVSDFEPESEAQDEEYEVGMPIPPCPDDTVVVQAPPTTLPGPVVTVPDTFSMPPMMMMQMEPMKPPELPVVPGPSFTRNNSAPSLNASISIDGSLTKLFQCMSLAYRQKLTSPKWNRFKGVRLRWKDKIRLNNVIWRCWHMQFILKQRTLVCQFASPLDVDQHNKPEAVVMEGKYWKRKLSTVAAEYKKWRLFYRNKMMGWTHKDPTPDLHPVSLDGFDWNRAAPFGGGPISSILFDDDLLMDFSDTLFSSLSSQPFAFPNPREIARAGMFADFIQPGLVQLQPNLEDFMDTLEPLQDYVNSKLLPSVPEELDSFHPPDSLLPVGVLPPLIQKGSNTSTITKPQGQSSEGCAGHQSVLAMGNGDVRVRSSPASPNYSSQVVQQPNYYQMSEMNGPSRQNQETTIGQQQATPVSVVMSLSHHQHQPQQKQQQSQQQLSPSSSNSSLLKGGNSPHRETSGHQSSANSRGGYSSRHDIFAKPVGKPRGRSRNGASSGRTILALPPSSTTSACPPPPPPNNMTHSSMHPNMSHSQMSNSMSNSTTLLSHLLTNSGNGNHYVGPTPVDKMGTVHGNNIGLGAGPSILQISNAPQSNMMASVSMNQQEMQQSHHHHQLQQQQPSHSQTQQPWNPKNANETINPNAPINFGMAKPMLSLNHNQQNISVGGMSGGAGNVSPPLLSNTPSPPMGPPVGGPASPSKPFRPKTDTDREHRRVCHINAEQKRRCNIKNGFDMLHSLIPQLSHNPNAKVSKAAMLQKGAEYIRQLKLERAQLKEEIEAHRQEVEALNSAINNCQSMLPATGAPVSRQRTNKMKEMFDQWVRCRTTENWKFWIFSVLIRPLLDSYNNSVSTASVDEMCRTVLAWVDQHCSLVDLRPAVLNSLRYLCTTTDILTNPSNLPEEAYKAVNRAPRDNSDRESR